MFGKLADIIHTVFVFVTVKDEVEESVWKSGRRNKGILN